MYFYEDCDRLWNREIDNYLFNNHANLGNKCRRLQLYKLFHFNHFYQLVFWFHECIPTINNIKYYEKFLLLCKKLC